MKRVQGLALITPGLVRDRARQVRQDPAPVMTCTWSERWPAASGWSG